jgi:hypothetical protein
MKGEEEEMKILRSERLIPKIVLLMLLSLNLVAGMAISARAAPTGKSPNVLISGSGGIELTWKSGKVETYSSNVCTSLGGLSSARLLPSRGWCVESFLADGKEVGFIDEDGYIPIDLIEVAPKQNVSVTFVENGGVDDVEKGDLVADPDPDVRVTFTYVDERGFVFATTIGLKQLDQVGESWDIWTDGNWFSGAVTIELVLRLTDIPSSMNAEDLKLYKTEIVLGDVNLDGVVDGTDVSMIANHNPSRLDDPNSNYDPRYDIALPKGVINDEDVNTASHNIGMESVWIELQTTFEIDNGLVYYRTVLQTSEGSPLDPIFGVHA